MSVDACMCCGVPQGVFAHLPVMQTSVAHPGTVHAQVSRHVAVFWWRLPQQFLGFFHLQEHLQCSKPEAALPFILLFGSICRSQPELLCQHLPQLKECLAQLPALGSDDAALALLLALWPLCRLHSDLQDHLLLLLRKALISREVACRYFSAPSDWGGSTKPAGGVCSISTAASVHHAG